MLFFGCSGSKTKYNDLEQDNLKGRVKSVTREAYYFNTQKADSVKNATTPDRYDSKTVTEYNPEGYISSQTNYIYGGKMVLQCLTTFDASGLPVKTEQFTGASLQDFTLYKYENDHYLDVSELFDADGELQKTTTYTYTDDGLLEKKVIQSAAGIDLRIATYSYDGERHLNSIVISTPFGMVGSRQVFSRDSSGRLLEMIIYNGSGLEIVAEKYNSKGYPSEWSSADQVQTYTYEYDAKGNWTLKRCFEEGKELYCIKSQYQYY